MHIGTIRDNEARIHTCALSCVLEMLSAACREGLRDGLRNDFALSRAYTFFIFTADIQLSS